MVQLVAVGSVAFDSIETPFGKLEKGLGGSATFFSLSASHFTKVGIVGVVGDDFPKAHEEMLQERGIDLAGFTRAEGETFRWEGEYSGDLNVAKTLDTRLNVFADFKPDLPESYRLAPFVFLANIDPTLQVDVLEQIENPDFVAMDTMNFWIDGKLDELKAAIKRVDALLINDLEARELAKETNIVKAIEGIHQLGPKIVVVKRGEYGAMLSCEDGFFYAPAFPIDEVRDPTGAGDSFGGGFVGFLAKSKAIDGENLRRAVIAGSVMASFCVEDFGTKRLQELTYEEIRQRAVQFRELMQTQPLDDHI